MSMEILAPAGSTDALIAGVRCGANAVYLGMKNINVRRNAANFGTEELASDVKYCHERNVKVYVTLNILVSDEELETAVHTAKRNAVGKRLAFLFAGVARKCAYCAHGAVFSATHFR